METKNYPHEYDLSHRKKDFLLKNYQDLVPFEDSLYYSTNRRRLANASQNFDEDFNNLRHNSQSRDKKTIHDFDVILDNFSRVTKPVLYYPRLICGSVAPLEFRRHRFQRSHSSGPPAYIDGWNQNVDLDNLPTRRLKAHPKLIIEVAEPEESVRIISESESEWKKRRIDERLDKLLGYRAPRYNLSQEAKNVISSYEGPQIKHLFNRYITDEDENDFTSRPNIRIVKHIKNVHIER